MTHAPTSMIDFDAITGGNLFPLSGRVRCVRCSDRASVIVNGSFLCGDCFLERTTDVPTPKEPNE